MIYDYPQYYEVAFSFRDITKEAAFLRTCIDRFSQVKVDRVLEIACGLAPHADELTGFGYQYLGLDNSRKMLDYAVDKLRDLRPRPEFIESDMASFVASGPVDFAFVMLGSLYLGSMAEMSSHLDSLARALRPGGLYFLDSCIQFEDPMNFAENNAFTCERDGITVESRFDIRSIDADRQMYEEIWTLDINDHGQRRELQVVEHNRAIFPDEFLSFVQDRPDFEFVGWWREWDLDRPITNGSKTTRPVTLLRRK